MNQPDLFGGETLVVESIHGTYARRKAEMGYRKATEQGVNCGTCMHSQMRAGGSRHYRKCDLIGVSASMSTDISRGCVCTQWEMICPK